MVSVGLYMQVNIVNHIIDSMGIRKSGSRGSLNEFHCFERCPCKYVCKYNIHSAHICLDAARKTCHSSSSVTIMSQI